MSGASASAAAEGRDARLEQMAAAILQGQTDIAALNGLTVEEMEAIYGLGYGFYTAGQHREALDIFRFLCLHRHLEPKYWLGLGAVNQMLGDYGTAVQSYAVCGLLDPTDPQVSLRAAECFIALGDAKSAGVALEAVLQLCAGAPQYAHWAERAGVLREHLSKMAKAGKP
jgi:type III secretion system low calcium response chaperone LcrH/SycD